MSDDQILKVVSAHKEGKKIERCRAYDGPFDWKPCTENESYDFHHYIYRVAPEARKPREWRLSLVNGQVSSGTTVFYGGDLNQEIVRVREVLE